MKRKSLVCIVLLLLPFAAPAWNGAGHRLVAALAWQEMRPAARERASELLRRHPDYARWRQRQQEADVDYGVFQEASTWPDDIRRDPRFHDWDEPPTPRLPGFPDMLRQRHWHYLDRAAAEPGEIDTRLLTLANTLAHGKVADQVYALPWFLHLVADLHQPLHTGGRDDRGGNAFTIENPYAPRQPFMSLHRYWDDLPGPPWLRGRSLDQALQRHIALPPPAQGDVADWLAESQALLAGPVYPNAQGSLLPLVTPAFHRRAQAIAAARLAAAGRRLGRWLDQLLAPVPRPPAANR
ncbi:MAG: S1/P1 nuclease [Azovibrio sp.]|nr:S1/P1 nuclease [Azovibrio sp.]